MVWNFFKDKMKNKKGSSILLLLIASIMVTAFGFTVYRFILSFHKYNSVRAKSAKYWNLSASLKDIVGRPENCIGIFGGKKYLPNAKEIEFELGDIDENFFNNIVILLLKVPILYI